VKCSPTHPQPLPNTEQQNPTSGRKNFKLKADMTITGIKEKGYKGYGTLYKFAVEEEIDHGKSVVARFATYTEADAAFFHGAVAAVLKELHAEAGIEEEEAAGDEEEQEEAAPAPKRNNGALMTLFGLNRRCLFACTNKKSHYARIINTHNSRYVGRHGRVSGPNHPTPCVSALSVSTDRCCR
jgi:hypothetical protein